MTMILRIAVALVSLCIFKDAMASSPDQTVLAPDSLDDFVRPEGGMPTLADLLTLETRVSIFYSYSRETDMSARFSQKVDEGEGSTLFVPTNKAVQALSRKPHEDPERGSAGMSDAEHDSISKSNVQRWVGAHIVPEPNVNFTSSKTYNTLTSGATITFQSAASQHDDHQTSGEVHTNTDASHLAGVKGSAFPPDTDSAHFASIKGPAGQPNPEVSGRLAIDTDAAHLSSVKGPTGMKLRYGLAAAGRINTDAAHFVTIKGPVPADQAGPSSQTPIWKQFEINDGVHIIAKKQASNGVMYLIDGTVPV